MHAKLRGLSVRLLRDDSHLDDAAVARHLGFALSPGMPAVAAAAWLEGFLQGGGSLLVHDHVLLGLVGTLLSLNRIIPEKTRETARLVVRRLVDQLLGKLEQPTRQAVQGALSRSLRNRRPRLTEIDWHRTIRANLKNYQHEHRTIIPESLIGYGRRRRLCRWLLMNARVGRPRSLGITACARAGGTEGVCGC